MNIPVYGDQYGRDYDADAFAEWERDVREGKYATPEDAYEVGTCIIYPWYGVRGIIKEVFGREPNGRPRWSESGIRPGYRRKK